MDGDLDKLYKDVPEIISSSFKMDEPNKSISIYKGDFIVKHHDTVDSVNGQIDFVWLPSLNVKISGIILNYVPRLESPASMNEKRELFIDNVKFGDCNIYTTSDTRNNQMRIEGFMFQDAVLGDKSIAVEKIKFEIPNLRKFHGDDVKFKNENSIKNSKSRIILENDEYIILIDKNIDHDALSESLRNVGGYIILYSGELTKKRGNLYLKDSKDVFFCLSTFISFFNGLRCSPIFLQGLCSDEIIWTDYSNALSDTYLVVSSWPPKLSIKGFNEMWKEFSVLWKNESDKDFLITAVHWYVEANKGSGFVEGSIIMIQTALELIYNWLIIENKKMLIGKDSENITAANKIRLLLSQMNISSGIPSSLKNLLAFLKVNSDIIDGPDIFTRIRNIIVHSKEELTKIDIMIKHEVWKLGISYLELSILNILNYQGEYVNRCSDCLVDLGKEEYVPWIKKGLK